MPAGSDNTLDDDGLTPKQALFVQEYLIDLNATQAAIRAGYSENSAKEIGCQNLIKLNIQEAITKAQLKRQERTEVTQDRVLKELALIAFIDIKDAYNENGELLPIHEMPEDVRRAIGGMDYTTIGDDIGKTSKVKLLDKKGSLELLGKHMAMFTDKKQISGVLGIQDLTDKSDEELKAMLDDD